MGNLWARERRPTQLRQVLCDWPVDRPAGWVQRVNQAIDARELKRLELSERREQPYGDDAWVQRTVGRLGIQHAIRREGRPSTKQQEQARTK